MDNLPLVTIGIPTRNRAEYLKEALESALSQTYSNIEVVISDNASNDGTQEYLVNITDSRVRAVRQDNLLEMIDNWNICLENAKGEYFLLLSDDDILLESAIASFMIEFQNNPLAIVYSKVKLIDFLGEEIGIAPKYPLVKFESQIDFLNNYYLRKRQIYPCSTIFPRILLDKYDTDYYLASDLAAVVTILNKSDGIIALNDPVVKYRIHNQNAAHNLRTSKWLHDFYLLYSSREDSTYVLSCKRRYFFLRSMIYVIVKAGIKKDECFKYGFLKDKLHIFILLRVIHFLSSLLSPFLGWLWKSKNLSDNKNIKI